MRKLFFHLKATEKIVTKDIYLFIYEKKIVNFSVSSSSSFRFAFFLLFFLFPSFFFMSSFFPNMHDYFFPSIYYFLPIFLYIELFF